MLIVQELAVQLTGQVELFKTCEFLFSKAMRSDDWQGSVAAAREAEARFAEAQDGHVGTVRKGILRNGTREKSLVWAKCNRLH